MGNCIGAVCEPRHLGCAANCCANDEKQYANIVPSPQREGVETKLASAREVAGETPASVAQTV